MRLLLDSHVPAALVAALAQREVEARHLRDWREGSFLHASDDEILRGARADALVFVTADQETIPGLLMDWAARDEPHAGVILIQDPNTSAGNVGALARALSALLAELHDVDWTNRVVPLPRL